MTVQSCQVINAPNQVEDDLFNLNPLFTGLLQNTDTNVEAYRRFSVASSSSPDSRSSLIQVTGDSLSRRARSPSLVIAWSSTCLPVSSISHKSSSSHLLWCVRPVTLVCRSCRLDLNDRDRSFSKSVVKDHRHRSVVCSAAKIGSSCHCYNGYITKPY